MSKKVFYFLPTILLLSIYFIQFVYPKTQEQLVTRVLDGDTIELENGERIRLIGINAPETDEPFYQEAKLALEEMVFSKKIAIQKDTSLNKDKYGRLLRYVFSEGKLVNCEMVRLGLAKVTIDSNGNYFDCLRQAEQEAREKKLGLWSSS
jgi:micrococcal nuclease